MASDIRVIPELVEARRLALAHNVVPVTHSFISDLETPVSAFLKLGAPRRSFLLESAEQGQHMGRYSFLGVGARALVTYNDGRLIVQENGDRLEVEHDDPFAAVSELLKSYRPPASPDLPPLAGGLVGYFGYDLVRRLEPVPDAPPDDLGLPEMAFLLADTVLVFDHLMHTVTVVANAFGDGRDIDGAYGRAVRRIADVRDKLARPLPVGGLGSAAGRQSGAVGDPARLRRRVAPCYLLDAARHTRRASSASASTSPRATPSRSSFAALRAPIDVSSFAVYRGLRAVNPSPYMYYIAFDDVALSGSSPEPLVTVRTATQRRAPSRARASEAPAPPSKPA